MADYQPLSSWQDGLDAHLQAFLMRKVEMVWGLGSTPPVTSTWQHDMGPRLFVNGELRAFWAGETLWVKSCYEKTDPRGYQIADRMATMRLQLPRRPKFEWIDPDIEPEQALLEAELVFATKGLGDTEYRV